ncbi:Ferrous-iron efflux pump FieF [Candidatus Magnetaquicoccaceae bacterium FCR-1]|uniref:Ferrous-iron efflux pump FieF n=1 Tax=Candidatus Magnetaquiglobus chichijimensis TaxID=3141448 RepID=A0ABQ0C808_9PROT
MTNHATSHAHEHFGPVVSNKEGHYAEARLVTLVGTGGDTLLTLGKLVIGFMAGSAALVAEGAHSGADLLFDLVVLAGMKIARKKPDEEHPYGHGKFEGLITLLLALILIVVAGGVVIDAVHRMSESNLEAPGHLAFWIAMGSVVIKEALFQYTVRVGRRIKSNIMMANAWHHRADAISCIAATLGIGGALLGFPILDPVAAIAVAFFVSKVAFEIGHKAIQELTDASTAVDQETRQQIHDLIHSIPEVISAHFVTPRQLGPDIIVDVHVVVPMDLTVSEGHQVAEKVRHTLLKNVDAITEVVVHVDTEDDMASSVPIYATRKEILAVLQTLLPTDGAIEGADRLYPHYSRTGIHLDLVLRVKAGSGLESLHAEVGRLCEGLLSSNARIVEVKTSLASVEPARLPS